MNSSTSGAEDQAFNSPTGQQLSRSQRKRLRRKQLSKAVAQKLTLENAFDSTKIHRIDRKAKQRLHQYQREFKKGLQLSKEASIAAAEEKSSADSIHGSKSLEIREQSSQRLIARQQLIKAEEKRIQYLNLKQICNSISQYKQ